MNVPGIPGITMTENLWRGIIVILSGAVILFTLWCLMHGITTIFMHLYYFPIVLLAYHYRWKGFGLATLLAFTYLGLVLVFDVSYADVILGAVYRVLVFIGIAAVIAYLSERLAAEKRAAQESTELRERYISLAPAIILVLDRNGVITFLNRKGGEILECTPEEAAGKTWADNFLPEQERERVNRVFSRLAAGEAERNNVIENLVRTCSGTEKIIRWYNTVLLDESGVITGILAFGEDVTEEKKAQDSLRKMQQFQESVITNANVWISVLAPGGTLLVWNDAAEAISGYKKSEVIGKNTVWKQLYPDNEYRKKVTRDIQRIIGRDTILENFETDIRCADGTTKTIVWNTRGLRDNQGTITSYIAIGRDVTAQKSAESRAGESSRFLGTMIDTLPMPIFFKDAGGRYIGCNPLFEEYIGIKRDHVVGKTVYDLSPKDLADKYAAADRQVFDNPVPQRYETQVQYADGSRHDVIFYKAPFFKKDGSLGGLIGAFLDITDRKRSEEMIKTSETRYRRLFESAKDGILILDRETGEIIDANPFIETLLGYTHAEIIGKHLWDVGLLKDQILSKIAFEELQAKEYIRYEDLPLNTKDGQRKEVEFVSNVYPIDHTSVIQCNIRDITDRRRTEEALKASEVRFRTMADWTYDWEYWIDRNREVLYVSPSIERITGYSADEFIADRGLIDRIIHPDDRLLWESHVPVHFQAGSADEPVEIEFRILARDGTIRWIGHTCRAIQSGDGSWLGRRISNRDITDRKRAEEALIRSEQTYRSYVDNSPVGIFIADGAGHYTDVNRASCDLLGYAHEELLSMNILDLALPGEKEQTLDQFTRVTEKLKTESSVSFEIRLKKKDGSACPVILNIVKLPDDSIMGFALDITGRKQTEEALRSSQARLHTLVQTIPDLIWLKDTEGVYLSCNPMFERFFGAKETDIVGKTDYDFVDRELADFFRENDRKAMAAGRPSSNEEWITFADDGHRAMLETIKTPVYDDAGTLIGVLGIGRDITGRKLAEDALRESRQLFSDIISFLPDPTFVIDKDGKVIAWNRAIEQLSGVSAGDIIGKGDHEYSLWLYGKRRPILIDLVLHPDQDYGRIGYTGIRRERQTVMAQTEFIRPGSKTVTLSLVASPLYDAKGTIVGSIESMRDITRLKETEDELARLNAGLEEIVRNRTKALEDEVAMRKQAEATIRASLDEKVLLLREIHHRVKNNLQIIISLTNLQMRTLDDPRLRQIMAETQNRVRAMSLVHERLYQSENLSSIHLADYTRYLATQLLSFYGIDHRKVALEIDIGRIPLDINTAIPLGLILNELISNALRHAFPEGRTGTLRISSHSRDGILTLIVKDDGTGLRPEFDWRNAESLGLRLVNSLVDQLGGTIEFGEGTGTTFIVSVPEKKE